MSTHEEDTGGCDTNGRNRPRGFFRKVSHTTHVVVGVPAKPKLSYGKSIAEKSALLRPGCGVLCCNHGSDAAYAFVGWATLFAVHYHIRKRRVEAPTARHAAIGYGESWKSSRASEL
jgi:hypothetical protein